MSITNVPQSVDDALARLESMKPLHLEKAARIVTAYGKALYGPDLLCFAALKRSMSHIDGFIQLLKARNFICAASLVRLQLDTLLRTHAMWMAKNPQELALAVIGGERIDKMKDQKGNRMRDCDLVRSMKAECPWIENVYRETSGYIHLSNKHCFNALQASDGHDGSFTAFVGTEDAFVTDEHRMEAILAFIDITERIFHYVDGWVFTKANPDVVKARREQQAGGVAGGSSGDGIGQGQPPASKDL